jgi:DNA-binding CsgD family transcriptional regulator
MILSACRPAIAEPRAPRRRKQLKAQMTQRDRRLTEADEAYRVQDWARACVIYREMVAEHPTPPGELLIALSDSLKYTGAFPEAAQAVERAYRAFVAAGDDLGAARCATRITGFRMVSNDRAGARAWERRGWQHLEKVGPCLERGYHAVAYVGCDIHDPGTLLEHAELALAVAHEFADRQLELRAFADMGLAQVSQGNVDEGFALMDEVMAAIVAGEMPDAQMRGVTLCALITACERSGDHGRAEHWGRTIEENPPLQEMGIQVTHCQIAFGAMDAMRGRFDSAEMRLQIAIESHATTRYHGAASRARLAELRVQQGRFEEAAEVLKGYEDEFEAAQALASLNAALGQHGRAAALLRTYIRGLGEDSMRLGPALALLVELELRRDDLTSASKAARRLLSLEEVCSSNEIRAMGRLAAARIANHKGDPRAAIDELETALTLLVHRDRPPLAAEVRLELARALAAAGDPTAAMVEAEAALTTFDRLGLVPHIKAGQEVLAGLGRESHVVDAAAAPRLRTPENLTRRETEVARLVAEGLTNREVADRLFLSVRTVETHVDRVLGKLDFHTRTQLAGWVQQGQRAEIT